MKERNKFILFIAFLLSIQSAASVPEYCPAIDCDCQSLASAAWIEACVFHEVQIKKACVANGNTPKDYCLVHGAGASPLPLTFSIATAAEHKSPDKQQFVEQRKLLDRKIKAQQKWVADELAANDYVQLFNALKSLDGDLGQLSSLYLARAESLDTKLEEAEQTHAAEDLAGPRKTPRRVAVDRKSLLERYSARGNAVPQESREMEVRGDHQQKGIEQYSAVSQRDQARPKSPSAKNRSYLQELSLHQDQRDNARTELSRHWRSVADAQQEHAEYLNRLGLDLSGRVSLANGKNKKRLVVLAQKALRMRGKVSEQSADAYVRAGRLAKGATAWQHAAEAASYLANLELQAGEDALYSKILAAVRYARAAHLWFQNDEKSLSIKCLGAAEQLVDGIEKQSLLRLIESLQET